MGKRYDVAFINVAKMKAVFWIAIYFTMHFNGYRIHGVPDMKKRVDSMLGSKQWKLWGDSTLVCKNNISYMLSPRRIRWRVCNILRLRFREKKSLKNCLIYWWIVEKNWYQCMLPERRRFECFSARFMICKYILINVEWKALKDISK